MKEDPLLQKYPYSILTPHYGILSEVDLSQDARDFRRVPYGPHVTGAFWQCFPTRDVTVGYDKMRAADSMGSKDVIVTMCDLEIKVRGKTTWSDYWGRRGYPLDICTGIEIAWKELTKNEKHVCFNGQPAGIETKLLRGKRRQIRGWVWNKFRTKKGCYSYFENECAPPSETTRWETELPWYLR